MVYVERVNMGTRNESGFALITALLILVLLAALLQGFILTINAEQDEVGIDRGQNQAFYGSLAGLEQLTAGLGDLMDTNASPTDAQLAALAANPPSLSNISFSTVTGQLPGFNILRGTQRNGTIPSGIYAGLYGAITPYTLSSTAHTMLGHQEVRMVRDLQVVLVPVFQFGVFSETDLSYFPGSSFSFGGRVHTNGNLYLAALSTGSVTLSQNVTAVGNVVRRTLSNGLDTNASGYTGAVNILAAGGTQGSPRALTYTEGSDNANWGSVIVPNYYNYHLMNGNTGAREMELPITNAQGASPIDIIKRPVAGEQASNLPLLRERHFSLASVRILLSDTAAEITSLPYVSADAPVLLSGTISTPSASTATQVVAASDGSANYRTTTGTSLIDGYIKVEIQTATNVWQDVTAQILNRGFTGLNLVQPTSATSNVASSCADPSPSSILRFQRLKDSPSGCTPNTTVNSWPNVFYDPREGALRPGVSTTQYDVYLGGVMHYIELDIEELCNWLKNTSAIHPNEGYLVYFSDRRMNKDTTDGTPGVETGEYGNEDVVNSSDPTNGAPDAGTALPNPGNQDDAEDVNQNGHTDVYGKIRQLKNAKSGSPLGSTALPSDLVTTTIARQNRPVFFRRALKVVNGSTINLGTNTGNGIRYGLTVTSENPVYVQGNYNGNGAFYTGSNRVSTAIMADAVTLLSNNWHDIRSFNCPHSGAQGCTSCNSKYGRVATNTWYGMAIIAGKGRSFNSITSDKDFGTDGGINNFLRYIENWDGRSLYYEGSLVSLYYSRQAVGTYKYKYQGAFFAPPSRVYAFNADFQEPAKLPPYTPRFRDINITGFTQMKLPD
jgi:hypothetical protein